MRSTPEHIAISKSKGVKIDWSDGHRSEFTLGYLRDECPCATCTGAHGTEPEKTNYSAPAAATPFPMFKPVLKMLAVEPVGHYAFRIDWSDGHNAGIYSYDRLREICPCAECSAARRSAADQM
jgi:DUF971 family protein